MKIAVIGSGISGLSSAYYLSKKHKVDLFEKEDHFGGHAHTIDIDYDNHNKKKISIDIGFIVFNNKTYPNLINFFNENKIEIEKSNMSFSVSVKGENIEYCGKGLNGIFVDKKNLFKFKFLKMVFEIIYFYNKCDKLKNLNDELTLDNYLRNNNLSQYFINYHILPMVSAIWSMPPYEAGQMPLKFFLKFFQNHGLFKIKNRPQWYTVKNRSRTYVNKVLGKISGEYFKNYNINKVERSLNGVRVFYGGDDEFYNYDKVVFATHADQTVSLLRNQSDEEKNILTKFNYKRNTAIIHTDEKVMPLNKKAWSSWNSSINSENLKQSSITYWLNLLQNLNIEKNIFLTLNPFSQIDKDKIIKKVEFTHPYYNQEALSFQKNLSTIQNKKNILFCGSYFGYGFHEDGIKSSMDMLKFLDD